MHYPGESDRQSPEGWPSSLASSILAIGVGGRVPTEESVAKRRVEWNDQSALRAMKKRETQKHFYNQNSTFEPASLSCPDCNAPTALQALSHPFSDIFVRLSANQ